MQIAAWKREAFEKLAKVFDDNGAGRDESRDGQIAKLHGKIDQLVVEWDFYVENLDRSDLGEQRAEGGSGRAGEHHRSLKHKVG